MKLNKCRVSRSNNKHGIVLFFICCFQASSLGLAAKHIRNWDPLLSSVLLPTLRKDRGLLAAVCRNTKLQSQGFCYQLLMKREGVQLSLSMQWWEVFNWRRLEPSGHVQVSGPEFAMDRIPSLSCFTWRWEGGHCHQRLWHEITQVLLIPHDLTISGPLLPMHPLLPTRPTSKFSSLKE